MLYKALAEDYHERSTQIITNTMAVEALERETQLPAEAAGLIEGSPATNDMAPIATVGGLLSNRTPGFIYSPLLGRFPRREENGYLRILKGGLASFDEMSKHIDEGLDEAYDCYGEPLVVGGHSLGGFFATRYAVNHPEKVAAVFSLAGTQAGIKGEKPAAKLLKHVLGNPVTAADLQEDSALMIEHKEQIASEWPEDVPLHLISPTTDLLIPIQQGLKLKLPDGQKPEKRVVVPRIAVAPFVPRQVGEYAARKAFRVPDDAELIQNSWWHADHFNLATVPAVISYVRSVRREAASAVDMSEALPTPVFEPALAVA